MNECPVCEYEKNPLFKIPTLVYLCTTHGLEWDNSKERTEFLRGHKNWNRYFEIWVKGRHIKERVQFT